MGKYTAAATQCCDLQCPGKGSALFLLSSSTVSLPLSPSLAVNRRAGCSQCTGSPRKTSESVVYHLSGIGFHVRNAVFKGCWEM